jgi:hypothetical protein
MSRALFFSILALCVGLTAWAEPGRRSPARAEAGDERRETGYPAFEFNLAGAAGSAGGQSFFEIQLGVNTVFLPWLVWRNAPFYRFGSNTRDVFGLDSSVLGRVALTSALSLDAGGGYRLATQGQSAPFLEARVGLSRSNLFFQVGVKYLMGSLVRAGGSNDWLYSIGGSAGARL